ncbi:MAG: ribose-5-phosphate isomerase A, partial [Thermoplasmata archaeon]|nr:ribose-5-phosphate isomerase A [Thermoplasmata archaeon]
ESKIVDVLGTKTPVPLEVTTFGWSAVKKEVEKLGCAAILRRRDEGIYITDNGNYILDCKFESIEEPHELEKRLNNIPGAIENGLFLDLVNKVIVAKASGVDELSRD